MKHLIKKISQLQCFDEIINVEPMTTGLSAHSFKVQTQQGVFFAKYLGGNDKDKVDIEINCNLISAKLGLTLKVYFTNEQWLITEFIEGELLAYSSLCLKDKLRTAVSLMFKFHQQSIALPVLHIYQTIVDLLNPLYYRPSQIVLLKNIAQELSVYIDVKGHYVCHGDVNFYNVLLTNDTINNHDNRQDNGSYLIDFECACKADVEFDIAMFLAINDLEEKYQQEVCLIYEHYSKNYLAVKINFRLVKRYLVFSYLINALWFYNKYQQNKNNEYHIQALKQFELFDKSQFTVSKLSKQMR